MSGIAETIRRTVSVAMLLERARTRSTAHLCDQIPPPPPLAPDAVARLYAAFSGRRDGGPDPYSARFRAEPRRAGFLFYPLLDKEVLQGCLGYSCGKLKQIPQKQQQKGRKKQ